MRANTLIHKSKESSYIKLGVTTTKTHLQQSEKKKRERLFCSSRSRSSPEGKRKKKKEKAEHIKHWRESLLQGLIVTRGENNRKSKGSPILVVALVENRILG